MISRLHATLRLSTVRLARTTIMGAALILGLLAGAAGVQQDSGFLADYSKLSPAADNPNSRLDGKGNIVASTVSSGTTDKTITPKQDITWQDLESITHTWAKGLRRGLDEARGVTRKS